MTPRPTIASVALEVAEAWARRSTCTRGSAGAVVLTREGHTLATGYNGAPAGLPHCTEVGCLQLEGRPECVRTVHAEANAILSAARNGVRLEGGHLYSTTRPCVRCTMMIIQAGIIGVWWRTNYETDGLTDLVMQLFHDAGIDAGKMRTS